MYDNHAHPGFADDTDVDAMAAPPDESSTLRLREDNPEFVAAAKALFAYPYDDFQPQHAKWLADKAKAAEQAGGHHVFRHHPRQAERGSLPRESRHDGALSRPQAVPLGIFRSIRFSSRSTIPQQTASTPDMGVYVPLQEKMLSRYKKQEGVEGLPADLAGYEVFVRRTIADNQQKRGGVAIKFEAAYFRSLLFFRSAPRTRRSHL